MKEETNKPKWLRYTANSLAFGFLLMVLYFGGFPIVAFTAAKLGLIDLTVSGNWVDRMAAPAEWLMDSFPPYDEFIKILRKVFGFGV